MGFIREAVQQQEQYWEVHIVPILLFSITEGDILRDTLFYITL